MAGRPPNQLSSALAGLWWDAKGDWTRAHESAQEDNGADGAWFTPTCIAKKATSERSLLVRPGEETSLRRKPRGRVAEHRYASLATR